MIPRNFLLAFTGWLLVADLSQRNRSDLLFARAYPTVLTVPAYDEDCFLIRTPPSRDKKKEPDEGKEEEEAKKKEEGDKKNVRFLIGNYEILSDPALLTPETVHVFIMDDEETIFYQSTPGKTRDTMHVAVVEGSKYWICIQNDPQHHYGEQRLLDEDKDMPPHRRQREFRHPDSEGRMVGFDWQLTAPLPKQNPLDPEMGQYTQQWIKSAQGMNYALGSMGSHFTYLRAREVSLRELVEGTFSSIMSWSLTEAAFVCLIAAGQVLYFRWFLESKKRYM